MDRYLMGQLARRADTTPETLRFYERRGLLQPPPRDDSGYRPDALASAPDDRFGEGCRVDLADLAEGGCLGPLVPGQGTAERAFPPPDANAGGRVP